MDEHELCRFPRRERRQERSPSSPSRPSRITRSFPRSCCFRHARNACWPTFPAIKTLEFGDHPPVPEFLKKAVKQTKVSATLLVEPGLFHFELGWPNQLQWDGNLGPLQVEFRGGAIFRTSTTEQVLGLSFLARGTLNLEAKFDAGFIGARLVALARIAYVLVTSASSRTKVRPQPLAHSALYAAIGVEIRVKVQIDFWLQFKVLRHKFRKSFGTSIDINFTAALELGIVASSPLDPGLRGTGTISVRLAGHGVDFDIHILVNEDQLTTAIDLTSRFLQMGLEAESVEPVPGTIGSAAPPAIVSPPSAPLVAPPAQPRFRPRHRWLPRFHSRRRSPPRAHRPRQEFPSHLRTVIPSRYSAHRTFAMPLTTPGYISSSFPNRRKMAIPAGSSLSRRPQSRPP